MTVGNETVRALTSAFMTIIAVFCGAIGFDYDATLLQNALSGVLLLASVAWGIWKNHNFTRAAQEGQRLTNAIKAGEMKSAG